MDSYDVICVGDVIIDAFLQIHDAVKHCRLNNDSELCVAYGGKINVDKCDFLLGGNACNVSVGISRMGLKSSLIAEIGDDEFSQKIIKGLIKEKVNYSHLLQTKGAASSFAIGLNFKGERTLLVDHVQRLHNFSFDNIFSKWVYLTSLGKDWQEAYRKTLNLVKEKSLKLAFNPGSLQLEYFGELKTESEVIKEVLTQASVLFVNKEEAVKIFNFQFSVFNENGNTKDIKTLLLNLQRMGPKTVVITDGKNGSYLIDENGKTFFLEMFPGVCVERTGAGDAYTSGFLSAMILGLPVYDAIRWGSINAASVVQKIGAQAGLLGRDEVENKLKENKKFEVKEL